MKQIFTKFIKAETKISRYAALVLVISGLLCAKYGYLDYIKDLLNSEALTITFGKSRLSAYVILKNLIVFVGLLFLAGMSSNSVEKRIKHLHNFKSTHRTLITKFLQIFIYLFFGFIALHMIGIDITTLAVFSGAIGIGIGVGLQKIVSNFISGFILLFEQSIAEGDMIETSTGIIGQVSKIGTRFVLLNTPDGKEVIIPSEDFITNCVTNWTLSNNNLRVELVVPVAYDSDIMLAYDIILKAALNHPMVMQDPAPHCYLKDFLNGAANLKLLFWVKDVIESHSRPKSDIQFTIWQEFKANKIYFAYPDMDMYKERTK